MERCFPVAFLVLVLAGCASVPPKPVWVPAEGTYDSQKGNYSVDLPPGWMRWNTEDGLRITRDGFPLQTIGVSLFPVGEPLKRTKKKFEKGMLPQELSAVLIDEIEGIGGVASSEVVENVPARFAGVEGFRVTLRIHMKNGEERMFAFYGAMIAEKVVEIYYSAPSRHYFQKDLETFEGVARSFRTMKPS